MMRPSYLVAFLAVLHLCASTLALQGLEPYLIVAGVLSLGALLALIGGVFLSRKTERADAWWAVAIAATPAVLVAALSVVGTQVQGSNGPAEGPLYMLTQSLVPFGDMVGFATRMSAVLFAALAARAAIDELEGRCRWYPAILQAVVVLGTALAPQLGALWLLALAPLVVKKRASVALAGAMTLAVLSDHALVWAQSLRVLDPSQSSADPSALLPVDLDPPLHLLHVVPAVLIGVAWLPAIWQLVLRQRRAFVSLPMVAAAAGCVLLVIGSWRAALERASSPAAEVSFANGRLVVGPAAPDPECVWTPRADETIASLLAMPCATVTLVGSGPSMRFHTRLGGLGDAFDLPAAGPVALHQVGLVDTDGVRVTRSLRVQFRESFGVEADGTFAPIGSGSRLVLSSPPSTPASRALGWVDALARADVSVAWSSAPTEP